MPPTQRRYSKEEIASRGDAIYEAEIRDKLVPDDHGLYLAIDIETGRYEIDGEELIACDRLRSHTPDAQIWMKLIGSPYVRKIRGGRWRAK